MSLVASPALMTLDEFFAGPAIARELFEGVRLCANRLGVVELRVTKSQVAFYHRTPFVWVWRPEQYLHRPADPLVLRYGNSSPRWKQVVEPRPGRFTHHLELFTVTNADAEVCGWLREAWATAG